jgi:hypothetical protein
MSHIHDQAVMLCSHLIRVALGKEGVGGEPLIKYVEEDRFILRVVHES